MDSLVKYLISGIPLAKHMQLRAGQLTEDWFELEAPLKANLNYKDTAFGGSLATVCTLAGWCVATKLCEQLEAEVDFSVMESQIKYCLPVTSDPIQARAYFPEAEDKAAFLSKLELRSRAAITIQARVLVPLGLAVDFSAAYHATLLPKGNSKSK